MIKGFSCIYKFTSPTGRVYVGQTLDLYSRYISHSKMYGNSSPLLYKSFKKYGFENHKFEIIEECEINMLNERERYWQEKMNSVKEGLNCKYTKSYDKVGYLSEGTKKKIGDAQRGKLNHRWGKKLTKEKNPMFGRKHSKETREKISKSNYGKIRSEKSRENYSKSRIGKLNPMYGTISPTARIVLNLETGIYYDSIKEAAISANIPHSTLSSTFNYSKKNKTNFIKI